MGRREGKVMLKGKCLCGDIHYGTTGTPAQQAQCHCSICRRASGASPVAWFTVPLQSFAFTQGRVASYHSSAHAVRQFCPRCGTQLTFHSGKFPDEIDITIASLDDPDQVQPKCHIHTSSKLEWVSVSDGLPVHREGAPKN
jgi:hypothetical protein